MSPCARRYCSSRSTGRGTRRETRPLADGHAPAADRRSPAADDPEVEGFTLGELLVTLLVVLLVAAGLFRLARDAQTSFLVQSEAVDVTQRARTGIELLATEIGGAGAGPSVGDGAGPLIRWVPPIVPSGVYDEDDGEGAGFGARITVMAVPDAMPLVAVRDAMRAPDEAIPIAWQPGCPMADAACGLRTGQRILLFDRRAVFELSTVGQTWPWQVHRDPVHAAKAWREVDGAHVVPVRVVTWYHDATRRQLRRRAGPRADGPVLDEVVGLNFRYFGDRLPPMEPRPPPGQASCLFDLDGVSRLPVLSPDEGDDAELTVAELTDGPWCGEEAGRVDADVYRIRRVRVSLRVQATGAWVRGRDPLLFRRPGTASNPRLWVPDMELVVDITPRNLQRR